MTSSQQFISTLFGWIIAVSWNAHAFQVPLVTYSFTYEFSAARDTVSCIISTNEFFGIRAISCGMSVGPISTDTIQVTFLGVEWTNRTDGVRLRTSTKNRRLIRFLAISIEKNDPLSSSGGELVRFKYSIPVTYSGAFNFLDSTKLSFSMVDLANNIVVRDRPVSQGASQSVFRLRLSVYPNPSHGIFNIRLLLSDRANVEFEAFDMIGRRIVHQSQPATFGGEFDRLIDLSALASGVYFLRAKSTFDNGEVSTVSHKILKVH